MEIATNADLQAYLSDNVFFWPCTVFVLGLDQERNTHIMKFTGVSSVSLRCDKKRKNGKILSIRSAGFWQKEAQTHTIADGGMMITTIHAPVVDVDYFIGKYTDEFTGADIGNVVQIALF